MIFQYDRITAIAISRHSQTFSGASSSRAERLLQVKTARKSLESLELTLFVDEIYQIPHEAHVSQAVASKCQRVQERCLHQGEPCYE